MPPLASTIAADMYAIDATAFASQFATPDTDKFSSSQEVVTSLPVVSASQALASGNVTTHSMATPYQLHARFSTASSGVARPGASASFSDNTIAFRDNQAMRDLLGPNSALDLLLNFSVEYYVETNLTPSRFGQAGSFLDINLVSRSLGSISMNGGNASIQNGPFEHTFSNSGFLTGLSENGGATTATLPIRISPLLNDGLLARFGAFTQVDGLALQSGFSVGEVTLGIPNLTSFVTLPDGTSAADVGLEFHLTPRVVPEPASGYVLVVSALSFIVVTRTSKRSGCVGLSVFAKPRSRYLDEYTPYRC